MVRDGSWRCVPIQKAIGRMLMSRFTAILGAREIKSSRALLLPAPNPTNPHVTCEQLLDHMRESMVYSEADLGPFQKRLEELRQIVKDDAANNPAAMIQLLERKLNQC
ncbi:16152_t:CDS:2, partial [Acaulospora colombiana]